MDMKPGWKTSEAWMTGIVSWLMHDVLQASDDWRVMCSAAFSAAIVAGVYIWSRTSMKSMGDAPDQTMQTGDI